MQWYEVVGWMGVAACCTFQIPQVVKTYRTGKVDGLSSSTLGMLMAAQFFMGTYGFMLSAWPVVGNNASGLILTSALMVMKLKAPKNPEIPMQQPPV